METKRIIEIENVPVAFRTVNCYGEIVIYFLQNEKMNENGVFEKQTSGLEKYRYAQADLSGEVILQKNDIAEMLQFRYIHSL